MDSDVLSDNKIMCCLAASTIATVAVLIRKRKKRMVKKLWRRAWLARREIGRGVLNMLDNELLVEDPEGYKNFLRMSNEQFKYILELLRVDIARADTNMRESVSAENRLACTLRFLATGETFRSLMYSTRIHESTIARFVPEVCDAIFTHLRDQHLKTPNNDKEWSQVSEDFNRLWNFPKCLGALDGRHIKFTPPRSDGSYYYNYKEYNSIVLMALVDANYKFTYINIGCNGRTSDGGVFRECSLSKSLTNNSLHLPASGPLPGRTLAIPHVIVADDAFPLNCNIMKPYPQRGLTHDQRIYNYRLSRARRIVENAFGILANRFRVLLNPINLRVSKVESITKACVALHNFLATQNGATYTEFAPGEPCDGVLERIGNQSGNKSSNLARNIRDELKDFFNSDIGAVPWQEHAINKYNM